MNCQWIGNSAKMEPMCCKDAVKGKSYCEEHIWLVYNKGTARARRKKDERVAAAVWDIESEMNAAYQELIDEGVFDY